MDNWLELASDWALTGSSLIGL